MRDSALSENPKDQRAEHRNLHISPFSTSSGNELNEIVGGFQMPIRVSRFLIINLDDGFVHWSIGFVGMRIAHSLHTFDSISLFFGVFCLLVCLCVIDVVVVVVAFHCSGSAVQVIPQQIDIHELSLLQLLYCNNNSFVGNECQMETNLITKLKDWRQCPLQ